MSKSRRSCNPIIQGHTLVELLVVLLILGIVAALAMSKAEPVNPYRAEAAAREVAQALRFAASAAQRTGEYHLVRCDLASNSIAITRLDLTANPPAADLTIPVFHPIDKKPYMIAFSAAPSTVGVAITKCDFAYSNHKPPTPQVVFGVDGTPVNVVGNKKQDVLDLSTAGEITVTAGLVSRSVLVAAVTGRVTISP